MRHYYVFKNVIMIITEVEKPTAYVLRSFHAEKCVKTIKKSYETVLIENKKEITNY